MSDFYPFAAFPDIEQESRALFARNLAASREMFGIEGACASQANVAVAAGQPLSLSGLLNEAGRHVGEAFREDIRNFEKALSAHSRENPAVLVTPVAGGGRLMIFHSDRFIHRNPEEGPAYILEDANGALVRGVYLRDGLMDRPPEQGPALRDFSGGMDLAAYYVKGRLHRDEAEGPAKIIRDPVSGKILCADFCRNGLLHRINGPATYEAHYRDEWVPEGHDMQREGWFRDGRIHRPSQDGPAVIDRDAAGNRLREIYVENDRRHRDPADGPAELAWRSDGKQTYAGYHVHGKLHREDGPAQHIEEDNSIRQCWWRHGLLSRDPFEGPALIWLIKDERRSLVEYRVNGLLHRDPELGPALILCGVDGKPESEEFWLNGEKITP
ncbi:hypothetical protein JDN40_02295 [Rhodomicrobium vannielii ATCC 17100]|uniref:hypothetical protein n=1 Tax=Rhodomicrobium vannielii TaxID=1069 RepID=UPI00191B873F|nr:hypothetical protein [Rhodomicrobium vannielii]MBJ7532945.1 hypothetical protein [Rhodomicrobium vannielii ATCC 17100]